MGHLEVIGRFFPWGKNVANPRTSRTTTLMIPLFYILIESHKKEGTSMLDVLYYLLQITAITGLIAMSPLQPALQPQTYNSTKKTNPDQFHHDRKIQG